VQIHGVDGLDQLAVQIVRFVDDAQRGVVACEFEDANGRRHTLIDKVPIFTDMILDANSIYPQTGSARCEILRRWKDVTGRELLRVTTAKPDDIMSMEDLSEFVVLLSQISGA
jgi:hypothetical protein